MIAESELIINQDGTAFHLHILPEDLADTVILVGDQGRVPTVASFFDSGSIECDKSSREFRTITGRYHGKRITVLSTGIGTDNIDIVVTELDALSNIDFSTREIKPEHKTLTILRIGTCGSLRADVPPGDFILSEIGMGCDGLLNWYQGVNDVSDSIMEQDFMNYMNWDNRLQTPYFVHSNSEIVAKFKDCPKGITMSAPGFYGPQGRSIRLKLTYPDFVQKLEQYSYKGHIMSNIEMENSAIVGLANLLGHKAATICCVVANRHSKKCITDYKPYIEKLIKYSLDCLTV
jgi:uridine phosphorylase